jgi:membrane protease YdiL (CAAX protease family)
VPRTPWRLRDLGFFIAFVLFALILCSFITFAGYEILRPVFGWHATLDSLRTNAFFNIAFQCLLYVIVLCYLYVLVVTYYRLPFWQGLGWQHLSVRRALKFAALGTALSFAIEFAPTLCLTRASSRRVNVQSGAYALALFAVLIAPPMEELLFRGMLFAYFERWVAVCDWARPCFCRASHSEYQGRGIMPS